MRTRNDKSPAQDAAPVRQELVVGSPVDEYTVSPPERATVAMFGNAAPVFETLTRSTPDLAVEPLLATAWEFRAPGTWRFTLRRGVTFHNGVAFNAQAAAWNVNERLAKQGFIPGIKADSAVVVDEFTIDVTPNPANMQLPGYLTNTYYSMVAPNTSAGAATSPESTPTGTGPFKFVSYQKDRELAVSRFDGYWGKKPEADGARYIWRKESAVRAAMVKVGEADIAPNIA
ncbi:MAG: ABC transporter substrate-binding protein, partial [Chloroflexota bacterium]